MKENESVLKVISAASFVIFFTTYLIAPLLPSLARELHSTENVVGLVVPAYLLPYGISTLFYGPLSDRIGRRKVILTLLAVTVLTTLLAAFVQTATQLIALRIIAGICTGGIIPIALALVGDLFAYEKRGHAMGWIFGAIAGGVAFGSTFGAALNPLIGWRWEFICLALADVAIFGFALRYRRLLGDSTPGGHHGIAAAFAGYFNLLKDSRAFRTYSFIFLNGMFQSGVFAWLGLYFARRYQLGDYGIGLALLGYGIPGMFLAPALGRLADRRGRYRMIPTGIFISASCALLLALQLPLVFAAIVVTALSFGFDMSHPPMVGIVSTLSPRRGLAMGLNAFILFTGFGLGSLLFQLCLQSGLGFAMAAFGIFEAVLGAIGLIAFAQERSSALFS